VSDVWPGGFVSGLVGGVVTLVILAIRAAMEGKVGVTFADLWTATAVGVAAGTVPMALARLMGWRRRPSAGVTYVKGHDRSVPQGGVDRFDRFTDGARRVLTFAQDEAQRFNHNYIGTEHLLLGLIREAEGVAAQVLGNLGVELTNVRQAVELTIGRGGRPVTGEVGLTPRAKRAIERSIGEARGMDHRYIGTEHLLLGVILVADGTAAEVLESLGVDLGRARAEIIRLIDAGAG
jgi:hypothetical protein